MCERTDILFFHNILESVDSASRIFLLIKSEYSTASWRWMKNFKNFISNKYVSVTDEIVWDNVQHKLIMLQVKIDLIALRKMNSEIVTP